KSVAPEGMSHWTAIWPPDPSRMIALLARTIPGLKLIELASGAGDPDGYRRRSPSLEGKTTARMMATAFAEGGMPHIPAAGKFRTVLADRAGPPDGPTALRVSATRQGASAKMLVARGVAVGVGVPAGEEVGVVVGVSVGPCTMIWPVMPEKQCGTQKYG